MAKSAEAKKVFSKMIAQIASGKKKDNLLGDKNAMVTEETGISIRIRTEVSFSARERKIARISTPIGISHSRESGMGEKSIIRKANINPGHKEPKPRILHTAKVRVIKIIFRIKAPSF